MGGGLSFAGRCHWIASQVKIPGTETTYLEVCDGGESKGRREPEGGVNPWWLREAGQEEVQEEVHEEAGIQRELEKEGAFFPAPPHSQATPQTIRALDVGLHQSIQ